MKVLFTDPAALIVTVVYLCGWLVLTPAHGSWRIAPLASANGSNQPFLTNLRYSVFLYTNNVNVGLSRAGVTILFCSVPIIDYFRR